MTIRELSLAAMAGLLVVAAQPAGGAAPAKAVFPTPSGRVTYKFKSQMVNGTTVLVWAEGGKFRSDTTAKATPPAGAAGPNGQPMPASTTQIKSWTISDGKNLYVQGPMQAASKTVQKMKLTPERMQRAAGGLGMPGVKGGKGKKVGTTKLLGKTVEIQEAENGSKVWMWKELPLKAEFTSPLGQITLEATKLQEPFKAPATAFKLPAGVKVVEDTPGGPGGGPAMRMNTDGKPKLVR